MTTIEVYADIWCPFTHVGLRLALVDGDERIRSSWETGLGRGVVGSPHFFTAGGGFFCPALHIERVDGHLRIAPDHDAFEAFVASVVGETAPPG